jgi:hypothetical protein
MDPLRLLLHVIVLEETRPVGAYGAAESVEEIATASAQRGNVPLASLISLIV